MEIDWKELSPEEAELIKTMLEYRSVDIEAESRYIDTDKRIDSAYEDIQKIEEIIKKIKPISEEHKKMLETLEYNSKKAVETIDNGCLEKDYFTRLYQQAGAVWIYGRVIDLYVKKRLGLEIEGKNLDFFQKTLESYNKCKLEKKEK